MSPFNPADQLLARLPRGQQSEPPLTGAPAALARVVHHADLYHVVVEHHGNRWFAYVPALPFRLVEGETSDVARQKMLQAVTAIFSQLGDKALASGLAPDMGMGRLQSEPTERDLRQALEGHEFRVHYQPTFDLALGRLAGMEALIRWDHPHRGLLVPRDFLPAAEALGLSPSMDDWVLEEACRQLRHWEEAKPGLQPFVMSVNLSRGQLHRPQLAQHVLGVLRANRLDPSKLRLEIPEETAVEDVQSQDFEALRAAGVQLVLDDVRAEHSAFVLLRTLTVASLKIDRPLVNELGDGGTGTALVRTITLLAHAWGMTVTAEGVETAEQAAAVQELGCDYGQGFYYGRPVPSQQAGQLLS